jgi:hypothetical protein
MIDMWPKPNSVVFTMHELYKEWTLYAPKRYDFLAHFGDRRSGRSPNTCVCEKQAHSTAVASGLLTFGLGDFSGAQLMGMIIYRHKYDIKACLWRKVRERSDACLISSDVYQPIRIL